MDKKEELLNTIMGCSLCGYYTCNKRDYIRHLETKKCKMRHAKELEKAEASLIKTEAICPPAPKEKTYETLNKISLNKQQNKIEKVKKDSISSLSDSSDEEEENEEEAIYDTIYINPIKFVQTWQSFTHFMFAFIGFIQDFLFQST